MQNITYLEEPIYFASSSSVGGKTEREGPLGDRLDFYDEKGLFGMKSYEKAEGEMCRIAMNIALKKCSLHHKELSLIVSGDLQNQCVATSIGLFSFGVPYLGLYGACSTCTESLLVLSSMMSGSHKYRFGAALTSSHNSAAERQFRTPLEYGARRAPSAQWTATACGAFIMKKTPDTAKITAFMPGRMIDGYTSDATNMGAAMALSAYDTISAFFENEDPFSFDSVVTGDLGAVGSQILSELLRDRHPYGEYLSSLHKDCGEIIFDRERQGVNAGGSGCGCSAATLSCHFLPLLRSGKLKKILFMSTGALMNPQNTLQGDHILGIAPSVVLEHHEI